MNWNMDRQELSLIREKMAERLGVELYAVYSEKQVAKREDGAIVVLDYHYRTLGRLRREGAFDEIRCARGASREDTSYIGYEVVDIAMGKHKSHRISRRNRQTGAA